MEIIYFFDDGRKKRIEIKDIEIDEFIEFFMFYVNQNGEIHKIEKGEKGRFVKSSKVNLNLNNSGYYCSFCERIAFKIRDHTIEHFMNFDELYDIQEFSILKKRLEQDIRYYKEKVKGINEIINSISSNLIREVFELYIKELMVKYHSEKIEGGKSDYRPDSDFDPEELKIGIEIELEHTNDREIAKEIAKDHLEEHPKYYSALVKMEKALSKEPQWLNAEIISHLLSKVPFYTNWSNLMESLPYENLDIISDILWRNLTTEDAKIYQYYANHTELINRLHDFNKQLVQDHGLWLVDKYLITSRSTSSAETNKKMMIKLLKMGIFETNSMELAIFKVRNKQAFLRIINNLRFTPSDLIVPEKYLTIYNGKITRDIWLKIDGFLISNLHLKQKSKGKRYIVYSYDTTQSTQGLWKSSYVVNGQKRDELKKALKQYNQNWQFGVY